MSSQIDVDVVQAEVLSKHIIKNNSQARILGAQGPCPHDWIKFLNCI